MHAAASRPQDRPSLIHIIDYHEYIKASPMALSCLLEKFASIVVVNEPCKQKAFSWELLNDICSPFEHTTLQG